MRKLLPALTESPFEHLKRGGKTSEIKVQGNHVVIVPSIRPTTREETLRAMRQATRTFKIKSDTARFLRIHLKDDFEKARLLPESFVVDESLNPDDPKHWKVKGKRLIFPGYSIYAPFAPSLYDSEHYDKATKLLRNSARPFLDDVLNALNVWHTHSIAHGDCHPANMRIYNGRLYFSDWANRTNLARPVDAKILRDAIGKDIAYSTYEFRKIMPHETEQKVEQYIDSLPVPQSVKNGIKADIRSGRWEVIFVRKPKTLN